MGDEQASAVRTFSDPRSTLLLDLLTQGCRGHSTIPGLGHEVLAAVTEDIVLRIHKAAGSQGAGRHRGGGIRNTAGFKRLVEDIRRAGRMKTDFRDLIAMIFDDIDRDPQPFSECNHRTALLLGRFVAKQFSYNLRFSGPEGRKIRAVWENMTRAQFRKWIDSHLVPFEGD